MLIAQRQTTNMYRSARSLQLQRSVPPARDCLSPSRECAARPCLFLFLMRAHQTMQSAPRCMYAAEWGIAPSATPLQSVEAANEWHPILQVSNYTIQSFYSGYLILKFSYLPPIMYLQFTNILYQPINDWYSFKIHFVQSDACVAAW